MRQARQLRAAAASQKSPDAVLSARDTGHEGLSAREAKARLKQHGPNELRKRETHPLLTLLGYFWGPIPWMIETACVLAAITGRWRDLAVTVALLAVNSGAGYWNRRRAERTIGALKDKLAPEARVLRDGRSRKIDARELVPGDIVLIRSGDTVPADVRLLQGSRIRLDESVLTGESLPVDKGPGDVILSGSSATRGQACGVVVATGGNSTYARTLQLAETAGAKSHFRRAVLRIARFLLGLAAVLVLLIVVTSLVIRHEALWSVATYALGLTLAAIPTALPAVLSFTMSIGARCLARMKAIVSTLSAIDEMAGLDVLCVDKTGTLTRSALALREPVLLDADDAEQLILTAALTANRKTPDAIDRAILDALGDEHALVPYHIKELRPFDTERRRAEADVERGADRFTAVRGAPQEILDLTLASEELRGSVSREVDELGENGYRVLGVALRGSDGEWRYLGLLALSDPPREDAGGVICEARTHGIEVRMITGDPPAMARRIARRIGLDGRIVEAGEVFGRSQDKVDVIDRTSHDDIVGAAGFAKVRPRHKYLIIRHLQADGHIVGMTGDGVDDAPALKQADVGIAVSGATNAARTAAGVVLTAPGLDAIMKAVDEARRIFQRMTSYATYRITETIRLLLFIALSVLVFRLYPLTPLMIVLLAILNDIPIMTIAWDHARLARRPLRWAMRPLLITSGILGVVGVASTFLLFWYLHSRLALPEETIRTIMFLKLLVAAHMTLYIARSAGWFWDRPWPTIPLLLSLETTQALGTLAAVYGALMSPIGWKWAAVVWGYSLIWMFLLDAVKVAVSRALRQSRERDGTAVEAVEQR